MLNGFMLTGTPHLVSAECCRWGCFRVRFASLEVHAFNETVCDGINVPDFAIRKDIATKVSHELMKFDVGNAAFPVDYLKEFHVRIKLLPLTGPVGPNLLFPDDTPAFRCLGPANVLTHESQGAVNISMIKGRVGLSYQFLCVRHESSSVDWHGFHVQTLLSQYTNFTTLPCEYCGATEIDDVLHCDECGEPVPHGYERPGIDEDGGTLSYCDRCQTDEADTSLEEL